MAGDGALILEWPETSAPFTRSLLMLRPVEPAAGAEVYDPDGMWIDELDDVEVLDRSQATVGDSDALSVDVTASAGAGEVPFLSAPGYGGTIVLRDSDVARVWIIDLRDAPPTPMMFFAPVLTDDTARLSEADAVVESMVLDPVQDPPDAGLLGEPGPQDRFLPIAVAARRALATDCRRSATRRESANPRTRDGPEQPPRNPLQHGIDATS